MWGGWWDGGGGWHDLTDTEIFPAAIKGQCRGGSGRTETEAAVIAWQEVPLAWPAGRRGPIRGFLWEEGATAWLPDWIGLRMGPVWGLGSWVGASERGVRSLRGWERRGETSSPNGGVSGLA